jgi:hypothetical protein
MGAGHKLTHHKNYVHTFTYGEYYYIFAYILYMWIVKH